VPGQDQVARRRHDPQRRQTGSAPCLSPFFALSRPALGKTPVASAALHFPTQPSAVPFLSGGAYVGCIMQFSRINSAVEGLQIGNASSDGFSFVISFESRNGPGLHGHPGFVASWRPIYPSRCAIKVGGSPFKTFAEAEEACSAILAHLICYSASGTTRQAGKIDP
jgi:hypothetical protein